VHDSTKFSTVRGGRKEATVGRGKKNYNARKGCRFTQGDQFRLAKRKGRTHCFVRGSRSDSRGRYMGSITGYKANFPEVYLSRGTEKGCLGGETVSSKRLKVLMLKDAKSI